MTCRASPSTVRPVAAAWPVNAHVDGNDADSDDSERAPTNANSCAMPCSVDSMLRYYNAYNVNTLPLPLQQSPPKSNTPIPSQTPLTTPNGIQIQSHFTTIHMFTCTDRQIGITNVQYHSALLAMLIESDALKTSPWAISR